MRTTAEWVAAVEKIRGYVKTYLGLKKLNARQQEALQIDLGTLDSDLEQLAISLRGAAESSPQWADARVGKIDLSGPSKNTYTLLIQWVAAGLGWATPAPGSLFAADDWATRAHDLAVGILGYGTLEYPVADYPIIPADVLEAVFGTTDPATLASYVESYAAKLRAGGAVIEPRPETGGA